MPVPSLGRRLLLVGVAALLSAGGSSAAGGSPATPLSLKGVVAGLPPNGPQVLYAPAPNVPQLQNRDSRFRATFNPVSGTERYAGREYQYTDFLYDDDAYTYPDDFRRYAGNAGDLAELRISARRKRELAVRFTLNTLMVPDSTIVTMAFDSDRSAATGSSTLPRDPGVPFPGTDQVLTTWGTGAQWSRWTGSGWRHVPLASRADTEANQITVTVPGSVARPSGRWRATLATGLYDPRTGGWRAEASPKSSAAGVESEQPNTSPVNVINLGFRFNEVPPPPPRAVAASEVPYARQDAALAAGEPTRFARVLDFDLLRSGRSRDNIPERGMMYRIFPSRQKTVMASTDGTPENGNPRQLGEGKDNTSLHGRYLSPLQPYALYVPSRYSPKKPAPLTFSLHGDGGEYFWLNESGAFAVPQLGEGRSSIVLSPSGRGRSGFYVGDHEYDVFEAWNDVARHFRLDPRRTAITGYSMGGYGSYRIGLLHPHLFARAVPMVPAICRGMWLIAKCTTTEETVVNRFAENARNLPVFHLADSLSELTFYPGQAQHVIGPAVNGMKSLDSLGYRYRFWSVAIEHVLLGTNHPEVAEWLGQNQIEPEPFHVTYARMPSTDHPSKGLLHNRAYWLSGIEVRDGRDPLAKGVVDAVSLGFGRSDPTSTQSFAPGVTAAGWAYLETQRSWAAPGRIPVQNRIHIKATNIRSVTIDPVAARVTCDVKVVVDSDGPLAVTLLGCP